MRVAGAKGKEGAGPQEPCAERWGDDSEVRILTRRTGVLLLLSVVGLLLIARTILVDVYWVHPPPLASLSSLQRTKTSLSHDISAHRLVLQYR